MNRSSNAWRFASKSHRRATSLVEMLVMMTLMGIITTISVKTVNRVMHDHGQSAAFHDAERSSVRLARQLRADAHRAVDCLIEESPRRLVLTTQDSEGKPAEIVYQWTGDSVTRRQTVAATPAIENFLFPKGVTWDVQQQANPQRLELVAVTDFEGDSLAQVSSLYVTPVNLQVVTRLGVMSDLSDAKNNANTSSESASDSDGRNL